MHLRSPSVALFLVMAILLTGLLAGCGGGDQQSGNGEQGDASGGKNKQADQAANKQVSAPKIALGTIKSVKIEKGKIVLKPSTEEQGEKPIPFKIKKDATITLDNERAELADIKEGQQAQITYVIKNERNKTSEIALFSDGATSPGGGDKTG